MSFKNWQPDLEIRVAPEMVGFLFLIHALALASLFLSAIKGVVLFFLLGMVLVSGTAGVLKNLFINTRFSMARRVVRLSWSSANEGSAENWTLYYANGKTISASLHPSSVITPYVLFLTFSYGFRKEKLILTQHNVHKSEWRRLAVGLRFGSFA
ncbi:MAG: hypothetical protein JKY67_15600 [Pseudomonadales bacterium]|nr:hypothetical protein [Pseudomonadales bacterium]